MSRNNSLNNSNFHHRREPIHIFASSRGSLDELRNLSSPLKYITSPAKYASNRFSPVKSNVSTGLNRSPQLSIHVQRVLNPSYPSKYIKFSTKIELLQKNLNRLNGQHESLKQLFNRSTQIMRCSQIILNLQKLKQKLQNSKTNKYIQEKRYEARYEVAYEQFINRFQTLKNNPIKNQAQAILQLQNLTEEKNKSKSHIQMIDQAYERKASQIKVINDSSRQYLKQIKDSLQKQFHDLMQKHKVNEIIEEEEKKIMNKIQLIKVKLGQLKCITQYEMFLEKQYIISQGFAPSKESQNVKNISTQSQKTKSVDLFQLKALKEERNFLALESLDRITFQLANIDSQFVRILEKYESQKNKLTKIQKQNGKAKTILGSKSQSKTSYLTEISSVQKSIFQFNYELAGLRAYIEKCTLRISNLCKQVSQNENNEQNEQFLESIFDLEQKSKILTENLSFFKSNCS